MVGGHGVSQNRKSLLASLLTFGLLVGSASSQASGWCDSVKVLKFAGLNWESGMLLTDIMMGASTWRCSRIRRNRPKGRFYSRFVEPEPGADDPGAHRIAKAGKDNPQGAPGSLARLDR